ncbi:YebC/PmpR family DNA-binding transcriptional regulator, partial [Marinobacter sp.]|uniref:YebC/PmpR family DNA-binding transcriptional regulator n=1 Tax=Marinobacter sp. TaxID=50741 RepID=UPI0035C7290D
DVTDIENEDGLITVFTPNTEYAKTRQALADAFPDIDFETDEIQFLPKTTTPVEGETYEEHKLQIALVERSSNEVVWEATSRD